MFPVYEHKKQKLTCALGSNMKYKDLNVKRAKYYDTKRKNLLSLGLRDMML